MKTWKHLIEYAITDECMDKALKNAIKGKRNRSDVKSVIEHKDEIKERLRKMMLSGEYEFRIHEAKYKRDGINKKLRIVVQPYFTVDYPEQWLQHIMIEAIKHVILRGIYFHSFGSVPSKGVHSGKKYLEKYIEKHKSKVRYVFKADIGKFYSNINTELLKAKFAKIIKDKLMLKMIFWCIDNNECRLPDGTITKKGINIGGYPSQFFANFFLQQFDHYVKEQLKAKYYIRYMDDIVVLDTNKRVLHNIKNAMIAFLKGEDLTLKSNYQVYKFDYVNKQERRIGCHIDFMGFKFYRDKTTIRRQIFYRSTRLATRLSKAEHLTYKNACRMVSYLGWYKVTKCYIAYKKYILDKINIEACKALISKVSKRRNHEYTVQQISKQPKAA